MGALELGLELCVAHRLLAAVQVPEPLLGPLPREDLVGYGRVVQSDRELFWCEVEVAGASGALVARGTVIYRIVQPEAA